MNVTPADINGKSRRKEFVQARQIVMYIAHTHTSLPASRIGRLIGGRDHSTVIPLGYVGLVATDVVDLHKLHQDGVRPLLFHKGGQLRPTNKFHTRFSLFRRKPPLTV